MKFRPGKDGIRGMPYDGFKRDGHKRERPMFAGEFSQGVE